MSFGGDPMSMPVCHLTRKYRMDAVEDVRVSRYAQKRIKVKKIDFSFHM